MKLLNPIYAKCLFYTSNIITPVIFYFLFTQYGFTISIKYISCIKKVYFDFGPWPPICPQSQKVSEFQLRQKISSNYCLLIHDPTMEDGTSIQLTTHSLKFFEGPLLFTSFKDKLNTWFFSTPLFKPSTPIRVLFVGGIYVSMLYLPRVIVNHVV